MSKSAILEPTGSVRWKETDFVAEVNAQQVASAQPNPVRELWPWFKSERLYHEAETEQITRGTPAEQESQSQKHMLAVLINVGGWSGNCARMMSPTSWVSRWRTWRRRWKNFMSVRGFGSAA